MTTAQLLQLIRIAVWENQQHPWAVHAITCLLQDILEADQNSKAGASDESVAMEVDSSNVLNEIEIPLPTRSQSTASKVNDISYADSE